MDRHNDNEKDKLSKPGIPRPGKQVDQQQIPGAPSQPEDQRGSSSQWIPPSTGNPDLDPNFGNQTIDLRERTRNPLIPQGMLIDQRQLMEHQRRQSHPDRDGGRGSLPPGARFDPYGPPDPSQVGPGVGPLPSAQFGDPDPDHFQPPGVPQLPNRSRLPANKSLKFPGPNNFPPPGGAGGSPFL